MPLSAVIAIEAPIGRPKYNLSAAKEYAAMHAPLPQIVGQFTLDVAGSVGVRRLNRVLQLIKYIPLKIEELGFKPLPEKQMELAMLSVRTCLPTIVSPIEWRANRPLFLKMLGLTDSRNCGGVNNSNIFYLFIFNRSWHLGKMARHGPLLYSVQPCFLHVRGSRLHAMPPNRPRLLSSKDMWSTSSPPWATP